jgi:hypothetical protein
METESHLDQLQLPIFSLGNLALANTSKPRCFQSFWERACAPNSSRSPETTVARIK